MTSSLRRYGLLTAVSLFVGAVTYMTPYTRLSDLAAVNDLFSGADTSGGPNMAAWASPSVWLSLCVYFAVKLVTTVLSISLPIPCGLFMPLFVREQPRAVGASVHPGLCVLRPPRPPPPPQLVPRRGASSASSLKLSSHPRRPGCLPSWAPLR